MPNCKSIPSDVWGHTREALIRYFSSRHGDVEAEDLAQKTLVAVWVREDYEFGAEADFPKVCLGFARNISQERFRESKNAHSTLDFDVPSPGHHAGSHGATESRILLEEVCRAGAAELKDRQWQVIRDAAFENEASDDALRESSADANRERVYLHRARQKLREITGMRKK